MGQVQQLCYLAQWFISSRILGRRRPLQSVVFVTGGCNSSCRHCTKCNVDASHFKSFSDIERDFQNCYYKGARILDIEGVNLLSWKDGEHTVGEIFDSAKRIGFYNTSTMIPAKDWAAWTELRVNVDVLWISISGKEELPFLDNANKASLYMVVNSTNFYQLPEILEFVQSHRNIQQIAFNFHTPFAGTEALALSPKQRESVIKQLISYKKKGYRIMNTVSGLKNMLSLDFKRFCWICNFIYCDGRQSPVCIDDPQSGICEKCGFSMSGEMNAVFRFRLDTILAGLKSRT